MDGGSEFVEPELLCECLVKLAKLHPPNVLCVSSELDQIRAVLELHRPGSEQTALPHLILSRIRALRVAALSGHFSEWCWDAGSDGGQPEGCIAMLRPLVAAASQARLHFIDNHFVFNPDELRELATLAEEQGVGSR